MSMMRSKLPMIDPGLLEPVQGHANQTGGDVGQFAHQLPTYQAQGKAFLAYDQARTIFGQSVDPARFEEFQYLLKALSGRRESDLFDKLNAGKLAPADLKSEFKTEMIDPEHSPFPKDAYKENANWAEFCTLYAQLAGDAQTPPLDLSKAPLDQIRSQNIDLNPPAPFRIQDPRRNYKTMAGSETRFLLSKDNSFIFLGSGNHGGRTPVRIREEFAGSGVAEAVNVALALLKAGELRRSAKQASQPLTTDTIEPIAQQYESILRVMAQQQKTKNGGFTTEFEHRVFQDATFGYIEVLMLKAASLKGPERRQVLDQAQSRIADLKMEQVSGYQIGCAVLSRALAAALGAAAKPLYHWDDNAWFASAAAESADVMQYWNGLFQKR